jgi:HSP20 family protein
MCPAELDAILVAGGVFFMAQRLARRERFGLEWPSEMFRRLFDGDWEGAGFLRMEEFRNGDTLVLRAEVPGIDPEKDVDLTVTNGVLRIRAERQERSEQKEKDQYRSEFRYGVFVRDVPLPDGVKQDDIQASYHDGVLEIRVPVPKDKGQGGKKIPVSRG